MVFQRGEADLPVKVRVQHAHDLAVAPVVRRKQAQRAREEAERVVRVVGVQAELGAERDDEVPAVRAGAAAVQDIQQDLDVHAERVGKFGRGYGFPPVAAGDGLHLPADELLEVHARGVLVSYGRYCVIFHVHVSASLSCRHHSTPVCETAENGTYKVPFRNG